MSTELALEHLRVIDLTHYIAGPYCTKLLADLGADVIKVERPAQGDGARGLGPFLDDLPGKERSGLFWYLNTNKRSVVLDLKSLDGQRRLRELVARSQVVVENFAPGTLESLGLEYESLIQDNPALVMTSLSNFGQTGPYRDYEATDIVANALTGTMSVSGDYDREPLKLGLHQAAFRAGQYAAVATLAGTLSAQAAGRGMHIDVSLMECLVTGLVLQLQSYGYEGRILRRAPKSVSSFGVHGLPVQTADGYAIPGAPLGSASWEYLATILDEPALRDPKFLTQSGRDEYVEEFNEILARGFKRRNRYELVQKGQEQRFGFAVVQSIRDLLQCLHLRERGYFIQVDQPGKKGVVMPGAPYRMTRTPVTIRMGSPMLGEHNSEVLGTLEKEHYGRTPQAIEGSGSQAPPLPLTGVRVLEPASAVAGPHAGQLLALLGAEVIKIESLVRPDNLRQVGQGPLPGSQPGRQYWNESGNHNENNLGKFNITLDFRTEEGRQAFRELVSISDVVLENFTPRVMKGFGLGYEDLVKVKPDLIMASVSSYGHTGPYTNYGHYGMGTAVMTGCAWVTGYLGGLPRQSGMAYSDDVSAMHALVAIMAALEYRNQSGKGQWIDVSMYEAGHFVAEAMMDYILNSREGERLGNRDRECVPQGCYSCLGEDQWVALSVCNQGQWVSLSNLIARPEMVTDTNFQTKEQRWERHDEIDGYISEWTRNRSKIQAMHELQTAGIPAGAVLNIKEVLLNRHLHARQYFAWVRHKNANVGRKLYSGLPFMFNQARLSVPRPAGEFGEHNQDVLGGLLGKSSQVLEDWGKRDIIGTVPLGARNAPMREVVPLQTLVERGVLQGYDTDYQAILERCEVQG